jgi:replication-associated recombination protein RarA
MTRRYGPGHFSEDPYSQIVSPHGIPVDDLVSVLHKEIRRSHVDNAVLAAYEMYTTSPDVAQHLWRRLRIIAVEILRGPDHIAMRKRGVILARPG